MRFARMGLGTAAVAVVLASVAACGGGSNSDSSSTPKAGTPAPATSANTPVAVGGGSTAPDPCTLLKSADFQHYLGGSFDSGKVVAPLGPTGGSCMFTGTGLTIDGKTVSTKVGVAVVVDDSAGTQWAKQEQVAQAFEGGTVNPNLIKTEDSDYSARKNRGQVIVEITNESSAWGDGFKAMPDKGALALTNLAAQRLP